MEGNHSHVVHSRRSRQGQVGWGKNPHPHMDSHQSRHHRYHRTASDRLGRNQLRYQLSNQPLDPELHPHLYLGNHTIPTTVYSLTNWSRNRVGKRLDPEHYRPIRRYLGLHENHSNPIHPNCRHSHPHLCHAIVWDQMGRRQTHPRIHHHRNPLQQQCNLQRSQSHLMSYLDIGPNHRSLRRHPYRVAMVHIHFRRLRRNRPQRYWDTCRVGRHSHQHR